MNQKIDQLRLGLRVVFYKEDGLWVAHCLEMDVMGHGKDKAAAFALLNEAIAEQLRMSIKHDNRANIFQPADGKFFGMFAAGRDIVRGMLVVKQGKQKEPAREDVGVGVTETREYTARRAVC